MDEGDVEGDVRFGPWSDGLVPEATSPSTEMLLIGQIGAPGGAEYYLDTVANDVDDYYLGRPLGYNFRHCGRSILLNERGSPESASERSTFAPRWPWGKPIWRDTNRTSITLRTTTMIDKEVAVGTATLTDSAGPGSARELIAVQAHQCQHRSKTDPLPPVEN